VLLTKFTEIMETKVAGTAKRRNVISSKSVKIRRHITEDDIRRRAYEIYLENIDDYNDPLEDWFRAESELREEA
jgi:hypothetical protein